MQTLLLVGVGVLTSIPWALFMRRQRAARQAAAPPGEPAVVLVTLHGVSTPQEIRATSVVAYQRYLFIRDEEGMVAMFPHESVRSVTRK